MCNKNILAIGNDPHIRNGCVESLKMKGYSIQPAESGKQAL
ncbi:MAG: hypothetical protein ACETVO_04500 [bacterium]